MSDISLTAEGRKTLADLAACHGVSEDAVLTLLVAIDAGDGRQAQFNHPDLGGLGQWSRGGMLMIGDMFNHALKAKVASLCDAVADLRDSGVVVPHQTQEPSSVHRAASHGRWPGHLGNPASTGSQNDMHYAVFPDSRRLAIDDGGTVTIYDTGSHRISGFSQQQGGTRSLRLTSQLGEVSLDDLPIVANGPGRQGASASPTEEGVQGKDADVSTVSSAPASHDEIFAKIEGLHALHSKGILSDAEFETKKADLLGRL